MKQASTFVQQNLIETNRASMEIYIVIGIKIMEGKFWYKTIRSETVSTLNAIERSMPSTEVLHESSTYA